MRLSVFTISLLFLAIHLVIAASVPLFDDEAYYALWARDLALGYYDHPPMIAYMIRMGTSLFGETALGIRLFPVLGFVASGYLVGDIARRVSGGAAGLPVLATMLYNLNLLVFALGSFATPDAPSTLFWVAALWAAVRAVSTPPDRRFAVLWWICTGLFIGFGGLSKFTNAFLAFGLMAYLIATPKGRAYLLTGLPYMAVTAAILPLLPYLFWNLQNDWLGLERQGARLVASGFSPRYLVCVSSSQSPAKGLRAVDLELCSAPALFHLSRDTCAGSSQLDRAAAGVRRHCCNLWTRPSAVAAALDQGHPRRCIVVERRFGRDRIQSGHPDRHGRQSTKPDARMVSDTRRHHRPAAGNGRQMDRHHRLRSNRIARPSFSANARLVRH